MTSALEWGVLHVGISCKSLASQMLLVGLREMEITGCEISTVRRVVQNLPVIVS
jgi:hypothetical protein